MDIASNSINRHRPIYDEVMDKLYCLTDETELDFDMLLEEIIGELPAVKRHSELPQGEPFVYPAFCDEPLEVTSERIVKAAKAIPQAHKDLLASPWMKRLKDRGVDEGIVKRYKMCDSESLFKQLGFEDAKHLSIGIHRQFYSILGGGPLLGVSIPYYYNRALSGFATRVMDPEQQQFVKYSFTTPARMCFNVDSKRDKEVYVAEGVFDAIALRKAGYPGMGLGDSQPHAFQLIYASKFDKIGLVFDNDYAGCLGCLKAHEFLMRFGIPLEIYLLDAKDPEEHFRTESKLPEPSSRAQLEARLDSHFDPNRYIASWWDHKLNREVH